MTAEPTLAAVLSCREPERLYSGLSLLVSTAADGSPCAGLFAFGALDLVMDPDLRRRVQEPDATPSLSWAGRERFATSLVELVDAATALESLELYACAASVETMNLTPAQVDERLDGVMSTPRFLDRAAGARLVFV